MMPKPLPGAQCMAKRSLSNISNKQLNHCNSLKEKRNRKLPSHTLRDDDLHLNPTFIHVIALYSQISMYMQANTTVHATSTY